MQSFNVAGPSFHSIPAFLKQISYQNPTNIADGPFQKAHNTKDPFFVWLRERPEHFVHFNNYMSGYRQGKQSWMDEGVYPVEERLVSGAREGEGEVFVVDVGGGLGHDLEELRGKLKRFPGRLVLQDQPGMQIGGFYCPTRSSGVFHLQDTSRYFAARNALFVGLCFYVWWHSYRLPCAMNVLVSLLYFPYFNQRKIWRNVPERYTPAIRGLKTHVKLNFE